MEKENPLAFYEVLWLLATSIYQVLRSLSSDDAPKVHETRLREPIRPVNRTTN